MVRVRAATYVVLHLHLHVHLKRAVVDLVLERLLALVELDADLVGLYAGAGSRDLGGELCLERPLGLHHQLAPRLAPARILGRLNRHTSTRHVADLDLAFNLGPHDCERRDKREWGALGTGATR